MANVNAQPAPAEPISALALATSAEPPPAPAPTIAGLLLDRFRPVAAHGLLFLMGISGGVAVATASSVTLHYLAASHTQVASARIDIQPQVLLPVDAEIQKAKAELDAALNGGS